MGYGINIDSSQATAYIEGRITAQKLIDWYPFKVKNPVVEVNDGFLWVYDGAKCKPWERPAKDYRNTAQYKKWRTEVFHRDNFTCQSCKQISGKLEAHHILKFHDNPTERYNIDNGVTLCRVCHIVVHRGKKNG